MYSVGGAMGWCIRRGNKRKEHRVGVWRGGRGAGPYFV
jgi:hypothetical protein